MRLKLRRTVQLYCRSCVTEGTGHINRMKLKITQLSSSISLNILKYVLLLLLADTVISLNCPNFKWIDTNDNNYIWSIVSEWRVVDCRVNTESVNATLWFNRNKHIDVDGDRIKLVSKNVFNITNLQLGDRGKYYCKACGKTKAPLRINVKKGTPFAKPEITNHPRIPIKYESNFKLECSLNGSYFDYEMLWFKVLASGTEIQVKSTTQSIWSPDYDKTVQKEVLEMTNFTQVNEGKYYCRVKRYAVNYVGKAFIELHLEELLKPVVSNFPSNGKVTEKTEFVWNHTVSGTPPPDIAWFKSVNGKKESSPISECSGKTKTCSPTKNNDIEVTMQSFVIKNLTYLQHHNVTYICQAKNIKGHDERNITMFVKTKPRLNAHQSKIQILKENLRLDCTLSKDVNPKNMAYSWTFCNKDVNMEENKIAQQSCQNEEQWKPIERRKNNFIVFKNQTEGIRLYRCIAKNEISDDKLIWTIVRPAAGDHNSNSGCGGIIGRLSSSVSENKENNSSRIEPIVIWQCIVAFLAVLLLITLFLTFHRRNPRKQDHSIHVLPVSVNTKIGDSV